MRSKSNLSRDQILADTAYYEVRFWSRVAKGDGCWEWTGAVKSNGYGHLGIKYQTFLAHRVAWTLAYGPIPDSLVVCHKCDNRLCCRPDHLFLGTIADNQHDMFSKGRGRIGIGPGELNEQAKLTASEVQTIRAMHAAGTHTQSALAAMFGVGRTTITMIVNRKNWRDT